MRERVLQAARGAAFGQERILLRRRVKILGVLAPR